MKAFHSYHDVMVNSISVGCTDCWMGFTANSYKQRCEPSGEPSSCPWCFRFNRQLQTIQETSVSKFNGICQEPGIRVPNGGTYLRTSMYVRYLDMIYENVFFIVKFIGLKMAVYNPIRSYCNIR